MSNTSKSFCCCGCFFPPDWQQQVVFFPLVFSLNNSLATQLIQPCTESLAKGGQFLSPAGHFMLQMKYVGATFLSQGSKRVGRIEFVVVFFGVDVGGGQKTKHKLDDTSVVLSTTNTWDHWSNMRASQVTGGFFWELFISADIWSKMGWHLGYERLWEPDISQLRRNINGSD